MSDDEMKLEAYVLNLLDDHETQELETQLANSPALQKELVKTQEALNLCASAEVSIEARESLRDRIFRSISTDTRSRALDKCVKIFDLPRKRIQDLFSLLDDFSQNEWQTTPIPGTRIHYFSGGPAAAGLTCGLMVINPGVVFPAHKHKGQELIVIVQGSLIDNTGNVFQVGDLIESQTESWHSFQVNSAEKLVFAVALEKPHRWLIFRTILDLLFSKIRFRSK